MKYAPVLIATLNRKKLFKNCIQSLAKCKGASNTPLYIALDFPPSDIYVEDYLEIKEFINEIDGFQKVEVIKRNENYGSRRNFLEARDYLFKKYDCVITSEDDNEFSENFLSFMNHGLKTYKDNPSILSICGYMYPINNARVSNQQFLYNGFSAWGWATWKEKYENLNFDINEISNFFKNSSNVKSIKNRTLRNHLKQCIKNGMITSDSYMCFYQIKNDMYSVFPKETLVRNMGNDGSGKHCSENLKMHEIYKSQKYMNSFSENLMFNEIKVDHKLISKIDAYLTNYTIERFLNYFKRLFFN